MSIAYIERNQKVLINGVEYNILRELNDNQYQLEKITTGKLLVKSKNELLGMLSNCELTFINERGYTSNNSDDRIFELKSLDLYSEGIQEKARERYAYVTEIKKRCIVIFTKNSLKSLIDEIWGKLGKLGEKPHWSTVNRWRKKFEEAGNDIRALVSRDIKKGNRKRRFPNEVLETVKNSIDEIYLTRERHSIEDVLEHATYRVIRENKLRPKSIRLPLPTRNIIKYGIKDLSAVDVCTARYGKQHAIRKYRSVENVYESDEILEVAEIDHTQIALFVVDEERMLPLGRPWLTIMIDNHSRSILGIHIGFNPPSYLTVSKCFKHAILPKADLKKEHPEIKNEWHSYGVMEALVVDNAFEFHSNHLSAACHPFGVTIQFTPRKTPWFKGKIERFNKSLEDGIATGTPGRTFQNILEKDDYDVAKNSTITLSTLKKIIHLWIVDYYHQDIHRTIGKTPYQAWADSAESTPIALPENADDLDSLLGSISTRTLSHVGVEIFSLKYNNPDLRDLRLQYGDKLKVDIRYNEDDLGYIYVIHPMTSEAIKVECTNQKYAAKLTFYQHKIIRNFALRYIKDNKNIEALCEAKEKIRELVRNDMFNKKSKSTVKLTRFMDGDNKSKVKKQNKNPILKKDLNNIEVLSSNKNTSDVFIKEKTSSTDVRRELKVVKSGQRVNF